MIVAGGMILRDVAVRESYSGWIVTPMWCADSFWRVVISHHDTEEEALAEAIRLRATDDSKDKGENVSPCGDLTRERSRSKRVT